jgi:hypothetical protein
LASSSRRQAASFKLKHFVEESVLTKDAVPQSLGHVWKLGVLSGHSTAKRYFTYGNNGT